VLTDGTTTVEIDLMRDHPPPNSSTASSPSDRDHRFGMFGVGEHVHGPIHEGADTLPYSKDAWDQFEKIAAAAHTRSHSWSGYNLVANLKVWQGLPADVQHVIERNTMKFTDLQRSDTNALNGPEARAHLTARGMIFTDPDTASFRAGLGPYYARWKASIGQKATSLLEGHVGRLG